MRQGAEGIHCCICCFCHWQTIITAACTCIQSTLAFADANCRCKAPPPNGPPLAQPSRIMACLNLHAAAHAASPASCKCAASPGVPPLSPGATQPPREPGLGAWPGAAAGGQQLGAFGLGQCCEHAHESKARGKACPAYMPGHPTLHSTLGSPTVLTSLRSPVRLLKICTSEGAISKVRLPDKSSAVRAVRCDR